jgi:hypothetical protein
MLSGLSSSPLRGEGRERVIKLIVKGLRTLQKASEKDHLMWSSHYGAICGQADFRNSCCNRGEAL